MKTTVLITGAVGGLGKAFAVECASRGYDLFLTDLRGELLEPLSRSLRSTYGVEVQYQPCDMTDADARAALFDGLRAGQRRFGMLINVAGVDFEGLFCEQTCQKIRTILRLNIEGTLEMMHAAVELRDLRQTFHVINVASLAAFYPMPYKATYAASKRFLLDFSLAMREELAAQNVTVTALCPAGMPTNRECIEGIEAQGWLGEITTRNVGAVAAQTVNAALRGRAIVIPGAVNRTIQALGSLIPPVVIAKMVGSRWGSAREKRSDLPVPLAAQGG